MSFFFLKIQYLYQCQRSGLSRSLIVYQSTSAVPVKNEQKKTEVRPQYPMLDTKFNQYQIAYRYRRNLELVRGYLVYRLFSINFLVNNQDKVRERTRCFSGDYHEKIELDCQFGSSYFG